MVPLEFEHQCWGLSEDIQEGELDLDQRVQRVLKMSMKDALDGLIQSAIKSCLDQEEYFNGYLSIGGTTVAEANISAHLAKTAMCEKHYVWAESPFKWKPSDKDWNHLDMAIVLDPSSPGDRAVLLVECKTLAKGKERTKLEEVLEDFERIRSWKKLRFECKPLDMDLHGRIKNVYGALIAIVPAEIDPKLFKQAVERESKHKIKLIRPKRTPGPNISDWWKGLQKRPPKCVSTRVRQFQRVFKDAYKHDAIHSRFPNGIYRTVILYALFDFSR
jgi:hypothetical protein